MKLTGNKQNKRTLAVQSNESANASSGSSDSDDEHENSREEGFHIEITSEEEIDNSEEQASNNDEVLQNGTKEPPVNGDARISNTSDDDVVIVENQSPIDDDYTCNWCFDMFNNDLDLREHLKLHAQLNRIPTDTNKAKCKYDNSYHP